MFAFSVNRPVIIVVAILIVCLFGIAAVFRVPLQMIPDLDARVVTVRTDWPGATPQDVEKEIVIEQEDYLRTIPNLERLVSEATTGAATIELEFPHGVDLNDVLIRVNNALAQVPDYPENVDQPRIVTTSVSNNPFMFFRVVPLSGNPAGVEVDMMRDWLRDNVVTRLERVRGVAEIEVWGGADRQVRIYLDPAKLAERDIALTEVRAAIRGRNRDVSGGDLDAGKRRYIVRTIGRFESVDDIAELIIARRQGVPVHLSEVGYAELDTFEMRNVSYANGVPNITVGVRRQVGSNVVETMDEVMAVVAALNDGLLPAQGLQMQLTSEDVKYVKDAVAVVGTNLLIGAALATAVLFVFLGSFSATAIGALGIPICTIAAFLGLMLTGRTINVISLAGIAFAIGMTLDNSIVVLENIYRHLSEGRARLEAAVVGVSEVWTAVLASTCTTVFVFLPIAFVEEEAGQLYSDIAIAISASILMSMIVAVTLVPTTAGRILRVAGPGHGIAGRLGRGASDIVLGGVDRVIGSALARVLLIGTVLALSATIILFLTPKSEYLPEGEEQKIFASLFAPPGYNIGTMDSIIHDLNDYLVPAIGADPAEFAAGDAAVPALNFVIGYARPGMIRLIPEATDRGQVDSLADAVSTRFKQVPGVIAFASRGSIFSSNTGGSRSINVDISGAELVPLFDAGLMAFTRAKEIFDNPQVLPEPSNLTMGQPLLEIRPDWERATELGLDANELGYAIWAFTDGAFVDEFFLGDDKIDIFLYSTAGTVSRPADVANILLYTPAGGVVPLEAVARVSETVNTASIRRINGRRTITLGIIPPRSVALEEGVATVRREIIRGLADDGSIGPEIDMSISGASDQMTATRDALRGNFMLALVVSYLLLVAIFSHWGYPLIIMLTVPIGISGGIVGLWLLNFCGARLDLLGLTPIQQPFDMITMMGFLILIGTVVNNPILIVEKALANLRRGDDVRPAVLGAVQARLRPIVMSTVTTVFGLSPLVLIPGAGTELYRGLGAIVLFGLLFSTIVTLTFMPALLSLVLEFRPRGARTPGSAAPAASR